ncbi:MAG: Unknown protein [uncultured Sulfurovum sp.]|uniref:Lipoprotein n=1 Tax=uncultured Sulfurovum sp. TaxID=269237 RepID=A0A6S6SSX3_9BACT|nr:MAG: Unknown protein [uncultured Sulfurovum sp.]
MKFLLVTFLILGITACSYEESKTESTEEVEKVSAVQIQVVGSVIEGLTVCFDKNNSCKQTTTEGMVEFDSFGTYSFKVRDIEISTLTIDNNRTIISPYSLFDQNDTLAEQTLLLLHAFDKSETIDDEEVLLTLSSYIPEVQSFQELFDDINESRMLKYVTNDFNVSDSTEHNITINFSESNITRDNESTTIVVPTKESYESLDTIMNFVDLAVDKNVTLDNFDDNYLLTKSSLTSFNLGDKYVVTAVVKKDHVVLQFFDNTSRTTDEAILVTNSDENVLSTTLLDIRFEEPEIKLE